MDNIFTTIPGPVFKPVSTTPLLTCGVYNRSIFTIPDGTMAALQVDQNGNLRVNVASGGGSSDINIAKIGGVVEGLTNPLPVELSDGTNPFGTVLNPLNVAATGTVTAKIEGNAGAIVDAAQNGTPPANAIQTSAIAATALPTAATTAKTVVPMADKFGRQTVVLNTVRDLVGTLILSNDSHTSAQNFGSAGGVGIYLDITTFVVTNRSATATVVTLGDGTNNYTYAIAANGGIVINFPTPLPASSTATQWTVLNSAGVACDYMAVTVANK